MDKYKSVATSAAGMVSAMLDSYSAMAVLSLALFLDFITGCWASYVEAKRQTEKHNVFLIESRKIRLSFSKMITYGTLILVSWGLSIAFFNKPFDIAYSTKQFTLLELTIGMCVCVECYSMIENMKRAGFDLIRKIKQIINNIWHLIDAAKGGDK